MSVSAAMSAGVTVTIRKSSPELENSASYAASGVGGVFTFLDLHYASRARWDLTPHCPSMVLHEHPARSRHIWTARVFDSAKASEHMSSAESMVRIIP